MAEKSRIKKINRKFSILDLGVVIVFLIVYTILAWAQYIENAKFKLDANSTFEMCFDILFGGSLACSAIFLSKFMTKVTGKPQNTCLLVWHVFNVFLMAAVYVSIAVISVAITTKLTNKGCHDMQLELYR